MAYKKQNFKSGDILLASQLNNIEDGIVDLETKVDEIGKREIVDKKARADIEQLKAGSGGAKIYNVNLTISDDLKDVTSNKTVKEISTAYKSGQFVQGIVNPSEGGTIIVPFNLASDEAVAFLMCHGMGNITIMGIDGSALGTEKDTWTAMLMEFTTAEDVDAKITQAIGTVENGSY